MTVEIDVRFRPVAPISDDPTPAKEPVKLARQRWAQALRGRPGVVDFEWGVSKRGAPKERPEEQGEAKQWESCDLSITWESEEHMNELFTDNTLIQYLCGVVAVAPAFRVAGEPQIQRTPSPWTGPAANYDEPE